MEEEAEISESTFVSELEIPYGKTIDCCIEKMQTENLRPKPIYPEIKMSCITNLFQRETIITDTTPSIIFPQEDIMEDINEQSDDDYIITKIMKNYTSLNFQYKLIEGKDDSLESKIMVLL